MFVDDFRYRHSPYMLNTVLLIKILMTVAEERITLKEYLQEQFPIKSYERRCNSTQGVSYAKEEPPAKIQNRFCTNKYNGGTLEKWRGDSGNRGPRRRQKEQGRSKKRRRRVETTTGVGKRRQLARVYTTALCSRRPHRTVSRVEQSERFYLSEHLFPSLSHQLSVPV